MVNESRGYARLLSIAPELLSTLSLPRLVVIGEESSGKSSTLERLANMPFFPADRSLCTRLAIELRVRRKTAAELRELLEKHKTTTGGGGRGYVKIELRRAPGSSLPTPETAVLAFEEVAASVAEWMAQIVLEANGAPVGVSGDVLCLEVYSTEAPNLDIVDLPGLVGGAMLGEPSDMSQQTRALTERYLADEHTLVCCVVSARAERVRNSQAFELVQRHEKQAKCVGVLTMCDRCADPRESGKQRPILLSSTVRACAWLVFHRII